MNSFNNGGFESGSANGWIRGGGTRQGIPSSKIASKDYKPGGDKYVATVATTHSAIVTSSNDPLIGTAMVKIVRTGNYSMRVEDLNTNIFCVSHKPAN